MNLEDLIEACKRNEELAWKLLYEQYSTQMRAVCFRYLGNHSDAEDLLQDCFIKIFTNIDRFKGTGSFEGWIRSIFVNSSLKFLRKKKSETLSLGSEALDKWDRDNMVSPLQTEESEKMKDLIQQTLFTKEELLDMLQQLPDGYRVVFNLYEIEEYSHKQIAKALSISINTSKTQLNRARKYLQQLLYRSSLKQKKEMENEEYRELLKIV
jgi:RNA polymerase sigma factor (sigma-70 family)